MQVETEAETTPLTSINLFDERNFGNNWELWNAGRVLLDKQRLRLTAADAHGLPLEDVQSDGELDGFARPPFALLRDGGPVGLVPSREGHILAQLVLGLELEDGVVVRVLVHEMHRARLAQPDGVDQSGHARPAREGDVVPPSLPLGFGAVDVARGGSFPLQSGEGGSG